MKNPKTWTAALSLLVLSGAAQAALVSRSGGMVYDTTRDITWLADMNYARTSGYTGTGVNANGTMLWSAAVRWADDLVYGGFSDWRLPTVIYPDPSCINSNQGCTGGELNGLFITDLGTRPNESVLNQEGDTPEQIANLALFSNVMSAAYWSGTLFRPIEAWAFGAQNGGIDVTRLTNSAFYAVAVRSGDVAPPAPTPAAAVPEPQTLALVAMALVAVALTRKAQQV